MAAENFAEWDTAYVNNLPDSAFAYIAPGGEQDADGKTTPRDLRKLPFKKEDGSVDLPHLRNALSRLPQADIPQSEQDKIRVELEKALAAANEKLADVVQGMVFMFNDQNTSIVEILKAGTVHDRGFKVTEQMLEDYVKNFDAGVYGTRVQVNLSHNREGEAAGWITKLIKEGPKLFAQVEWTPLGLQKIQTKQYQFTSAELALSYPHWQTGDKVKNVLIGVALTNVPAVKGLQPVSLSEEVISFLNNQSVMDKLKELYDKLAAAGVCTQEDMKAFADACLAATDVPADQKNKMMQDLAALVKKPEPAPAAPAAPQLSEKTETVSLAEFKAAQEANQKLQEKVDRMELSETFANKLSFSEGKQTGFVPASKDKVIDFMLGLTTEQRTQFAELVTTQIQTVDLSTHGSTGAQKKEMTQESVVQLAEKMMSEAKVNGKELSMRDAQKLAMKELSK